MASIEFLKRILFCKNWPCPINFQFADLESITLSFLAWDWIGLRLAWSSFTCIQMCLYLHKIWYLHVFVFVFVFANQVITTFEVGKYCAAHLCCFQLTSCRKTNTLPSFHHAQMCLLWKWCRKVFWKSVGYSAVNFWFIHVKFRFFLIEHFFNWAFPYMYNRVFLKGHFALLAPKFCD